MCEERKSILGGAKFGPQRRIGPEPAISVLRFACHFPSITSTSISIDISVASCPVRHPLLLPSLFMTKTGPVSKIIPYIRPYTEHKRLQSSTREISRPSILRQKSREGGGMHWNLSWPSTGFGACMLPAVAMRPLPGGTHLVS